MKRISEHIPEEVLLEAVAQLRKEGANMERSEDLDSTQRFGRTDENGSSPGKYDVVVLGSGEGSKYFAWTMARQGKHVAVIEQKYISGSCPNIACLPSKNIIHSAKVASYFRRSDEFGITKDGFKIDMSAVRERKRKMVAGLIDMHLANFKGSGAELIMGSAALRA